MNEKRFGADRDVIRRRSDNRHGGRRRCQRYELNAPPDGGIKCHQIQESKSLAQFLVFFQRIRRIRRRRTDREIRRRATGFLTSALDG